MLLPWLVPLVRMANLFASKNRERERALACRLVIRHNNQPIVGAHAVAGPLGWGAEIICIKNRERDRALALGGRHLVMRHNNQPVVSGSNARDDGEDARPGWSV